MHVTARAMGYLQARMPGRQAQVTMALPAGATVADLLARLLPDPAKVLVIQVNDEKSAADRVLAEADQVVLYPRIGGG
jgi:sulfur carrier protein ThiS